MKKIKKYFSDYIPNRVNEIIDEEIPDYQATESIKKGCKAIGNYLTNANDAIDSLNEFLDCNDDKTVERITEYSDDEEKAIFKEYYEHYLTRAVKADFHTSDMEFDKDTLLSLYSVTKAKITKLNSDLMFSILTLHNIERLADFNGYDLEDDDEIE